MKTLALLTIILLLTATMALTTATAEDAPQWLPEGAIARLGKGVVDDIKFSADSTRLVVASKPGVWSYDAQTGEEIDMVPWDWTLGRNGVLSPDGTLFVYWYWSPWDNEGKIYAKDTHTGEQELYGSTFKGHTSRIKNVAFSPDGRTLASVDDTTIRLWDMQTRQPLNTIVHEDSVEGLAFDPDSTTLASGNRDGTIRLWDVATGEALNTLTGHTDTVFSVAFSPDGTTLASGSWDTTIRLWDVVTGDTLNTLTGHTGGVNSVAFSPDGTILASGGGWNDSTVRLWDVSTGDTQNTLTGHTGGVRSVAFSPDGTTLVSRHRDTIRLWDVSTGDTRHTLTGHTDDVLSVAFGPDGTILASGSWDGTIRLWDVSTGDARHTLTGHTHRVESVAFSPDGTILASGDWHDNTNTIRLWDVATGDTQNTLTGHRRAVYSVAFSPDGNTLASGSREGTVRLWDVATGDTRHTLTGHTDDVFSVAFSPDGRTLASGTASGTRGWYSDDKAIRLWDVHTGDLRATLTGHTQAPNGFAFSPDGTTLISTSYDSTIRVWDVRNGKQVKVLGVPCTATSGPAMSPDGRFIAVGDGWNEISLIDIVADKYLGDFPGHEVRTDIVAINFDGTTLASGSRDGTVILWDLTPFTSTEQAPQEQSDSVRVVYFQPSDREYQHGINARMETLITDVQQFYAEQMQAHGHSGKTITFDEDFGVYHFTGKFTDAHYQDQTYDKVQEEISEYFYQSKSVYLVAIDISSEVINDDGTCGVGGGQWWSSSFEGEAWHRDLGGLAVIPASGDCFNVGVTAHELGHACGLDHDFRDDTYLMAYGSQQRLSSEAAAWLDASRLFNPSQPDLGQPMAIEMLSTGAAHLRFQVTDGDGLHQAQLLIPATEADPASGTKLHSGQALNGNQNSIVQFAVPELAGLSDVEVTLQVIDVHGNITKQTFSIETVGGVRVVGDINSDGVVNILDLTLVAAQLGQTSEATRADVNGDGVVNIQDLVLVAGAIGGDAAAPAALPKTLELFSTADVQQWLVETRWLSLTDAMSQRGVRFLEQLLAALTPTETALLPNYPNPFNPETWLPYRLAEPAEVTVRIWTANGTLIRTLALGQMPAGIYESRSRAAYWDGRTAQGEPVASGVYFYTLTAGDFTATKKMVIRK